MKLRRLKLTEREEMERDMPPDPPLTLDDIKMLFVDLLLSHEVCPVCEQATPSLYDPHGRCRACAGLDK